ncbi:hypothetical protein RFI_16139 [Reticulomyxa filosa]|uniref:Uncharacterized protein n=1 Tax=Reticulomyxa filosa TaxID=46433 RepID=X6N6Y6_RETFI|nr:hypothetical protein RFI_16139 [Reticulomyxa filosa]|eukprot:ETO21067.1 hypothetical protein RFI_16139 [Reticulomyxa filosa]
MPRDKGRKFLKQKFAQQHKKTPARKHEHDDDLELPAPKHPLDEATSKKHKRNKYESQSHKKERTESESDEEPEQWKSSGKSSRPHQAKTSTEDILESFDKSLQFSEDTSKVPTGRRKSLDMSIGIGDEYLAAQNEALDEAMEQGNAIHNMDTALEMFASKELSFSFARET